MAFFVTTQIISCKFIAFLNNITFSDSDGGSPIFIFSTVLQPSGSALFAHA